MIAQLTNDLHDRSQFNVQAERMRRDCPQILAWIAQSVAETKQVVFASDGTHHFREVGALRDLQTILDTISNPPPLPQDDDQGQGYRL